MDLLGFIKMLVRKKLASYFSVECVYRHILYVNIVHLCTTYK